MVSVILGPCVILEDILLPRVFFTLVGSNMMKHLEEEQEVQLSSNKALKTTMTENLHRHTCVHVYVHTYVHMFFISVWSSLAVWWGEAS